jgi:hypothetical protein
MKILSTREAAWENQRKDLDDVFFHARNRKQQIQELIRKLQKDWNASAQNV